MPSQSTLLEIRCPKCRACVTGVCWEKVDGDDNPELKAELLNGTLFRVKCATCNHAFDIQTEFRYIADSEGLYIYLTPKPLIDRLTPQELRQRQAPFQLLRQQFPHFFTTTDLDDMLTLIKQYSTKPTFVSTEGEITMPQNSTVNKPMTDELLSQSGLDPNDKAVQFTIGMSFLNGMSVSNKDAGAMSFQQSTESAIEWLKKAADQNHAEAQYTLGCIYAQNGDCTNTNYLEAANYFKRAKANKSTQNPSLMLAKLIGKIRHEAYTPLTSFDKAVGELWAEKAIVLSTQANDIEKSELTDIDNHLRENRLEYRDLDSRLNPKSTPKAAPAGTSGCFVATAIYGSYEAEEVRVLRQFRDLCLLQHATTAWIVRLYYMIGPKMASWVTRSPLLRLNTKRLLDRIVSIVDHHIRTRP